VLGISGLRGSGREELLPLIFGAKPRIGEVLVAGRPIPPGDPRAAMGAGMALVPSDRRGEGSIAGLTVRENCTLTDLVRHSTRTGRLRLRQERREVESWIAELDVRPPAPDMLFSALSGGNQQKIVLAKWLRRQPAVLLLDEPTQGVDVHAKAAVHALARRAAERGSAVVVASSDDNEICDICDRVLIVRDGCVSDEVPGDELTPHRLASLQLMSGGRVILEGEAGN
jgi:ribose transport system ATP-binding protein